MKRLIALLAASLMALTLGACGKQDTKPEAASTDAPAMEQTVPADEQKPAGEQKADEQKPSAQATPIDAQEQAQADEQPQGQE